MVKTKLKLKAENGKKVKSSQAVLERIRLKAAGLDVGSEMVYLAILDKPVQSFDTFTSGIIQAVTYLKENAITSVAMEATGIYWLPIFEALEEAGIEVYLVNGGHVKNLPGRKTDVLDSEWLRELHTYGLLRSSFVPQEGIRKLRYYVRLRADHITMGASHIQHIQKNLDAMNLKLHNVIDDIMGESGLKILRSILAGTRDTKELLALCHIEIRKNKGEAVIKSLEGHYKPEYLFGLKQALEMWETYQNKMGECDREIEKILAEMAKDKTVPSKISKPKQLKHNKPAIGQLHLLMMTIFEGRDATQITGINDYTLLQLISEVGLDLTKWPTSDHFTSWLGVSPPLHASGKGKKRKKRKVVNKAGQIFRQIARNVGNSKYSALAGFYRRIRSRSGALVANKATARKIAVYFYDFMTKGHEFVEQGLKKYDENYKAQLIKSLNKKAQDLGMQLVPV
jgi:transposase